MAKLRLNDPAAGACTHRIVIHPLEVFRLKFLLLERLQGGLLFPAGPGFAGSSGPGGRLQLTNKAHTQSEEFVFGYSVSK